MYDVLRAIHILFGVFLGGITLFELLIFNPRLRRLGPSVRSAVVGTLTPVMGPAMGSAAVIILGTGIAMALTVSRVSSLVTNVWGWSMIVSTAATLAFLGTGAAGVVPTAARIRKLTTGASGHAATSEQTLQLQQLSVKFDRLENLQIVYVLVGVILMLLLRFV